jgi:hypothetical protein
VTPEEKQIIEKAKSIQELSDREKISMSNFVRSLVLPKCKIAIIKNRLGDVHEIEQKNPG